MPKVNRSGREAATEKTVWSAVEENLAIVKRTTRPTGSSAMCANKIMNYEGETGSNCYSRGLEHQNGLRNEQEENPRWKHCTLVHGGEKVDFTMTALRSFRSCLKRQVKEAVSISSSQPDILLNSKSEFHQAPLTRLVAFMGLHGDQGEHQAGQAFPGDGGAGAEGRARAGRRNEGE